MVTESLGRRTAQLLGLGAITLVLIGGFWPGFGSAASGVAVEVISVVSAGLIAGSLLLEGSDDAVFTLLWAGLGVAVATGTLGVMSFGFVYLAAAILIAVAIALTPTRSPATSRAAWRYGIAFFVTYPFTFTLGFML